MPYKIDTTLTSKGQVTVPAEIRRELDLRPGDKLRFVLSETGVLTVEPRPRHSIFDRLEELKLPPLGRPLTQTDIDDAVADAMAEQDARAKRRSRQ